MSFLFHPGGLRSEMTITFRVFCVYHLQNAIYILQNAIVNDWHAIIKILIKYNKTSMLNHNKQLNWSMDGNCIFSSWINLIWRFLKLRIFSQSPKVVKQTKSSGASFLFFVVRITINNVDVTSLLVAALGEVGKLYEQMRFRVSDALLQIGFLKWDIWENMPTK